MFSQTKQLELGLNAAWLRNRVIANNIANESTPNFKSSRVEFESFFSEALDSGGGLKRTRDKHMAFTSTQTLAPRVVQNNDTAMRMDGNNVDIDYENAQLAKNSLYYMTLVQKMSSEFTRLKMAIREGG